MDDLKLTIIILVILGIISILILLVFFKKKQASDGALTDYCKSRNYSYEKNKNYSLTSVIIAGDGFSIHSTIKYDRNPTLDESRPVLNTNWRSSITDNERPSFVIGRITESNDWHALPEMVKVIAIQKLMSESGLKLEASKAQVISIEHDSVFLLFEELEGESNDVVQRIKPHLEKWPPKQTVYIKSTPDGLEINISDYFIKNVNTLQKVLELGEALSMK